MAEWHGVSEQKVLVSPSLCGQSHCSPQTASRHGVKFWCTIRVKLYYLFTAASLFGRSRGHQQGGELQTETICWNLACTPQSVKACQNVICHFNPQLALAMMAKSIERSATIWHGHCSQWHQRFGQQRCWPIPFAGCVRVWLSMMFFLVWACPTCHVKSKFSIQQAPGSIPTEVLQLVPVFILNLSQLGKTWKRLVGEIYGRVEDLTYMGKMFAYPCIYVSIYVHRFAFLYVYKIMKWFNGNLWYSYLYDRYLFMSVCNIIFVCLPYHIYIHIYIHIFHIYIYIHRYIYKYTNIHIYIYTYIQIHIYIYIYTYIHISIFTYIHIYICTCLITLTITPIKCLAQYLL